MTPLHITVTAHPPGHFGADDYESAEGDPYTLTAFIGEARVGSLRYEHRPGDESHVRWLEVGDTFRRRGVASALMDTLVARHPEAPDTAGLTDDGGSFWTAYWSRR